MYTKDWYDEFKKQSFLSSAKILMHLKKYVEYKSFLDIGCGAGSWMMGAASMGCSDIYGIDGEWSEESNAEVVKNSGATIMYQELNTIDILPNSWPQEFDLGICLEVAEHLEKDSSQKVVELLCKHCKYILFGAAAPGQGGMGHINLQTKSYWVNLFRSYNYYANDIIRPKFWGNPKVSWWYSQNTILYSRKHDMLDITSAEHPDIYHPKCLMTSPGLIKQSLTHDEMILSKSIMDQLLKHVE